jgi:hypothetical protein
MLLKVHTRLLKQSSHVDHLCFLSVAIHLLTTVALLALHASLNLTKLAFAGEQFLSLLVDLALDLWQRQNM